MPAKTARVAWNAADRLIAMIASHFSGGNDSIGATCWIPALLTRMSTLPNRSTTIRPTDSGSRTFTSTALTLAPAALSCSAAGRRWSGFLLAITTSAPADANDEAMPRPIPLVEPVTIADRPARTGAAAVVSGTAVGLMFSIFRYSLSCRV